MPGSGPGPVLSKCFRRPHPCGSCHRPPSPPPGPQWHPDRPPSFPSRPLPSVLHSATRTIFPKPTQAISPPPTPTPASLPDSRCVYNKIYALPLGLCVTSDPPAAGLAEGGQTRPALLPAFHTQIPAQRALTQPHPPHFTGKETEAHGSSGRTVTARARTGVCLAEHQVSPRSLQRNPDASLMAGA